MRIYKMTATFGKLEHETLTLKPGLNIITAPNEWGKSTWCAFLVAMLYGLDTRAKTTKTPLADKERYAPWSGSPMAGRIDLNWNVRDITIERRTKRRVPLGEFQAYETQTGIPVPELTAANCGQMLLGVEQTVFRRAGFIRHADLPVTQDEALRRRLNALVTTGDESGAADSLADNLRELKNKCRYNRSGLLPQAEAERDILQEKVVELETLEIQSRKLKTRLEEIGTWLEQLSNHRQALEYAAVQENTIRLAQAKEDLTQIEQELQLREAACENLPPREETEQKARELKSFREQWNDIQMESRMMPAEPEEPSMPEPFEGMDPEEAWAMAKRDAKQYRSMTATRVPTLLIVMGIVGLTAAAGLIYLMAYLFAGIAGAVSVIALIWGISEKVSIKRKTRGIVEKYGTDDSRRWTDPVDDYEQALEVYAEHLKEYKDLSGDLEVRLMVLQKKRDTLCGEGDPDTMLAYWQQARERWEVYHDVRREAARVRSHYEALRAVVKPVEKPSMPDHLTHSEADTARLLSDCTQEQQRLLNRLGQYQGRMELLGDKAQLQKELEQKKLRIAKLEHTYAALTLAQETLAAARAELQRRFAPRITKRAQKLLAKLTGGRYHSLIMAEDFSLQAGAGEEETLRDALWRSDGTMDQLYLALRLAVAEELTPKAPLILDDALVRFDDTRMQAAMGILREMSQEKQIICFTCQEREANV